jgi:hypothetical protein
VNIASVKGMMMNHDDWEKTCQPFWYKACIREMELQLKRIEERMDSMDVALDLRSGELERRLGGMNELREEVVRDRAQFVFRESHDAREAILREFITLLDKKIEKIETRFSTWLIAIALIVTVLQLFIHFMK